MKPRVAVRDFTGKFGEQMHSLCGMDKISIDPEVISGTPVFAGTRVPIQNLFDYIEGSEDLSEFLEDFPSVTKEAALAVLKMAKNSLTSAKALHENFS